MWICVGPRDPSTTPSRGWLRVVVRKSPVWFWWRLGRREIKLRRNQGPTAGGVRAHRKAGRGRRLVGLHDVPAVVHSSVFWRALPHRAKLGDITRMARTILSADKKLKRKSPRTEGPRGNNARRAAPEGLGGVRGPPLQAALAGGRRGAEGWESPLRQVSSVGLEAPLFFN